MSLPNKRSTCPAAASSASTTDSSYSSPPPMKKSKNGLHSGSRFKAQQNNRNVSYDSEVTAFVENRRMRSLTGIKSKELLLWATISEIFVNDQDQTKITFANPTGLSRTFPVTAFEEEEK
ncbi:hypothetical protein HID58_033481 [Brassica napus]|uniref:Uncharacterized protein n=1 Tax=Brassica napus TaxID=3708 RepID=A0ABQ8BZB9_BRANA|nr:hypothetical protein HID58_033481 [Brassica napus]